MKIFIKYKKISPKNYNEIIKLSDYVRLKTRLLCIWYCMLKNFFIAFIVLLLSFSFVNAEKVDKINVSGNERISKDTIIIFGEIVYNFIPNIISLYLSTLFLLS